MYFKEGLGFVLGMGDYTNLQEAAYSTSADGRVFKSAWDKFVTDFKLKERFIVLSLFHMRANGYVQINF